MGNSEESGIVAKKPGLSEALGSLFVLVGILTFLAVISYNFNPSKGNLIGVFGEISATYLSFLFGSASYFLGPYLILMGLMGIYRGTLEDPIPRVVALPVFLISLSLMLAIIPSPPSSDGGIIGQSIGGIMGFVFGRLGTGILSSGTFITAIIMTLRLPVPILIRSAANAIKSVMPEKNGKKEDEIPPDFPDFSGIDDDKNYEKNPHSNVTININSSASGEGISPVEIIDEDGDYEKAGEERFKSESDTQEGEEDYTGDEKMKRPFYAKEKGERKPWFQRVVVNEEPAFTEEAHFVEEQEIEEYSEQLKKVYERDLSGVEHPVSSPSSGSYQFRDETESESESPANKLAGQLHRVRFMMDEISKRHVESDDRRDKRKASFQMSYERVIEPREKSVKSNDEPVFEGIFNDAETRFHFRKTALPEPVLAGENGNNRIVSFRETRGHDIAHDSRRLPSHRGESGYIGDAQNPGSDRLLRNLDMRILEQRSVRTTERRVPAFKTKNNDFFTDVKEEPMVEFGENRGNGYDRLDMEPEYDSRMSEAEFNRGFADESFADTKSDTDTDIDIDIDIEDYPIDSNMDDLDDEGDIDYKDEIETEDITGEIDDDLYEEEGNSELNSDILSEKEPIVEYSKKPDIREKAEPRSFVPVVNTGNKKYRLPVEILELSERVPQEDMDREIEITRERLEKVMSDYGIQAKVVGTRRGPIITLYELKLEPGTRVSRVLGINDEIKMNLETASLRIVAPIPGRSTIGIEIPNSRRDNVVLGDLVRLDEGFFSRSRELGLVLGKDISGANVYVDLARLPHLLIAGATGAGKSVYMNSVIASLLYTNSPEDLRFIMIDPKMVELKLYEGIPHLLMPVITDVKSASKALAWVVDEMERRYNILSKVRSRDIRSYNQRVSERNLFDDEGEEGRKMPYIIVVIDELSDLMMVSAREVEDYIIRLTQKARAVGIHVIMATQRPSVDVITALIKANCPSRISFHVAQKTDSRTILDSNGAETLLGRGDMLYKSPTSTALVRIQAPLITEGEIEKLVQETRRFGKPSYVELPGDDDDRYGDGSDSGEDELFDTAWNIVLESGKTSTSYVQRRLRIGYNRAANLIELMEQKGYLSPPMGNKPREILKRS